MKYAYKPARQVVRSTRGIIKKAIFFFSSKDRYIHTHTDPHGEVPPVLKKTSLNTYILDEGTPKAILLPQGRSLLPSSSSWDSGPGHTQLKQQMKSYQIMRIVRRRRIPKMMNRMMGMRLG